MTPNTHSDDTLSPENCTNMAQVRAGVDATDEALIALLARRFAYMDAAARIKPDRTMVRDEERKAQVIANAVALAQSHKIPSDVIGALWEILVEGSIAHELNKWDDMRA